MQNDFIDGSLGTREAQDALINVKDKVNQYMNDQSYIVLTRDVHSDDYLNTPEGEIFPYKHCVKGTDGCRINEDIYNALKDYNNKLVASKPKIGCLDFVEFLEKIIPKNADLKELNIEICGLCTNSSIISNVISTKTAFPEINIIIDSKACAGLDQEEYDAALSIFKLYNVKIL